MKTAVYALVTFALAMPHLAGAALEGVITFEKTVPAGMLVWVPGVTRAAVPPAVIDQKDKVFLPGVLAARPGTAVSMHNSDAIQHNAFASDKAATFDTGLNAPGSDTAVKVDWPAGTVVRLGCKIHPAMQVWIAALDTDAWIAPAVPAAGIKTVAFSLKDLPADAATAVVWTSKYGQVELTLKPGVEASGKLGPADRPAATVTATLKP